MRVTKIIKDGEGLEGYTSPSGEIGVNIQLLWNETSTEEEFISRFCKVLEHELIHREIQNILFIKGNKMYFGEEVTVRKMTGETFRHGELEYYKNGGTL